ncbi:kinase, PfkB family [Clostridiales bacterium KA00134]|nr:kinase, PfkB family [Clostridiales bacterium KA00134]
MVILETAPRLVREYELDGLQLKANNKCKKSLSYPGGHGISCAKILNAMGDRPLLMTYFGGENGEKIIEDLDGIGLRYVTIKDENQEIVKLRIGEDMTYIESEHPRLTREEINEITGLVSKELDFASYLLIPKLGEERIPKAMIKNIVYKCKEEKVRSMVAYPDDISDILEAAPDILYLNSDSLEKYYETKISHQAQAVQIGKDILSKGLEAVFVESDQAYLICLYADESYKLKFKANTSNIDGNHFLAGLASGTKRKYDRKMCLNLAAACSLLETNKGDDNLNMAMIKTLMKEIEIIKL